MRGSRPSAHCGGATGAGDEQCRSSDHAEGDHGVGGAVATDLQAQREQGGPDHLAGGHEQRIEAHGGTCERGIDRFDGVRLRQAGEAAQGEPEPYGGDVQVRHRRRRYQADDADRAKFAKLRDQYRKEAEAVKEITWEIERAEGDVNGAEAAAEFMDRLLADPDYQARVSEAVNGLQARHPVREYDVNNGQYSGKINYINPLTQQGVQIDLQPDFGTEKQNIETIAKWTNLSADVLGQIGLSEASPDGSIDEASVRDQEAYFRSSGQLTYEGDADLASILRLDVLEAANAFLEANP